MKNTVRVAVLLVLLGGGAANARSTRSISAGVFTSEQAKNGERAYQAKCASCHGDDLHSTEPEAPDLTEGLFKFGWKGKTVAETFEEIRSTMPFQNPRSLDDQTYLDILTYIFHSNGVPAGNHKLEPDFPTLRQIVIEPPNN
jgi:cytochrome c